MRDIDPNLLDACRRGDRDAWERLLLDCRDPVYRIAYRLTGNREDAEDLTQDILLRLIERLDRFRGEASFSTWLYRLAVNVCLHHLRDSRPLENLSEAEDLPDPADPALLHQQEALGSRIEAEIAALPEPLRVAFTLVALEGMSYLDTAQGLEVSVEAVRMRVSRARQRLRERLRSELENGA